jgi:hypothetical protein
MRCLLLCCCPCSRNRGRCLLLCCCWQHLLQGAVKLPELLRCLHTATRLHVHKSCLLLLLQHLMAAKRA